MAASSADPRVMLLEMLLTKVGEEPFPSSSMLDVIEGLLRPDEIPVYVAVLMAKIERETFPSIPMMLRLHALVQ